MTYTTDYYVRRTGTRVDLLTGVVIDRSDWTGPIDDKEQAEREALAWRTAGWTATVERANDEVRAQVEEWEKERVESWHDSCDPSQRERYWQSVRATHEGED